MGSKNHTGAWKFWYFVYPCDPDEWCGEKYESGTESNRAQRFAIEAKLQSQAVDRTKMGLLRIVLY